MRKIPVTLSAFHGQHPVFDTRSDPRYSVLECPHCGGDNLHHEGVEIYNPLTEDSKEGLYVGVDGQAFDIRNTGETMIHNPSARRHGLVISFTCEACPAVSAMTLVQHKGLTIVTMHVVDPEGNPRPEPNDEYDEEAEVLG